jgi:hypothetical protein
MCFYYGEIEQHYCLPGQKMQVRVAGLRRYAGDFSAPTICFVDAEYEAHAMPDRQPL